jgi:competence protein ComEA
MVKNFLKLTMCALVLSLFLCTASLAGGLININTATVQELTELPGIGPATAAKIVDHRESQPFQNKESIMDVKGIGPAKYEAIKELITVDEKDQKQE